MLAEDIRTRASKNVAAAYESQFRARNLEVENQMKQFEFGKQKELRQVSIDGQIQLAKNNVAK